MTRHEETRTGINGAGPKSKAVGRDSSSIAIAPAYNEITEGHVLEALRDATIRQLATALDPGAFRGDNTPDRFRCPQCGSPGCASVIDAWRWSCTWCDGADTTTGGQSTRLALRSAVAHSYEASLRLVHDVAGPGLRTVPGGRS